MCVCLLCVIFIRNSPASSPVVLLALVGVVCATTLVVNGDDREVSSEPTSPWSHLHLLQLTVEGVHTILLEKNLENATDHPVTALLGVSNLNYHGISHWCCQRIIHLV